MNEGELCWALEDILGEIKALSGPKTVTGPLVGNVGPNKIATGPSRAQSYNPHIYERAMVRPSGALIWALEPSQEGPDGTLGPPDPVVVSRKKKKWSSKHRFSVKKKI